MLGTHISTITADTAEPVRDASRRRIIRADELVACLLFVVLFWEPIITLVHDWWTEPDAAHGLLLAPVAIYLAWKTGLLTQTRPQRRWGIAVLLAAVTLRYLSGLADEPFTMRASLIAAIVGLIVFAFGWRQVVRWWLPLALIFLSIPLPAVLLKSLAFPLQLQASAWGAALLKLRHVPVLLEGNVLQLPGRSLFVTEACSGLRSLTALVALGLLLGGLWLRKPWSRGILVLATLPVAMALNAVRVFVTGFLVYFVNPALADGFSHFTEGWMLFVVAFAILGGLTGILGWLEQSPELGEVPSGRKTFNDPADRRSVHRSWWAVTGVLALGAAGVIGIRSPQETPLRIALPDALPRDMNGFASNDLKLPDDARTFAGVTDYLYREYVSPRSSAEGFSLYVGYYDSQLQGKMIHSPKNCLPGSGWEALQASTITLETSAGPVTVNRYLVQKGQQQALVLYWYQGRGHIQADEYAVKWNLLRDVALRHRSEEALVRIVVPITTGMDSALELARQTANRAIEGLQRALPV